jgi:hypothetical protein
MFIYLGIYESLPLRQNALESENIDRDLTL